MTTALRLPRYSPDLDWRVYALCAADPELWYPKRPQSKAPDNLAEIEAVKAICRMCPVLAQCKADIEATEGNCGVDKRYGIRAGMTARERYNAYRHATSRVAA